jgi:hypothetical protein
MVRLLGAALPVLAAAGLALSRADWTTRPSPPATGPFIGLAVCIDPPANVIEWLRIRYEQFVLGRSWKTCRS